MAGLKPNYDNKCIKIHSLVKRQRLKDWKKDSIPCCL